MITNTSTPLAVALLAACQWLKRHKELKTDPDLLLEFVSAWIVVAGPVTETEARQCGIHAVKEIAGCVRELPQHQFEVIEPEDLRD